MSFNPLSIAALDALFWGVFPLLAAILVSALCGLLWSALRRRVYPPRRGPVPAAAPCGRPRRQSRQARREMRRCLRCARSIS